MFVNTCIGKIHVVVHRATYLIPVTTVIPAAVYTDFAFGKFYKLGDIMREVGCDVPLVVFCLDRSTAQYKLNTCIAECADITPVSACTCRFRN